MGKKEAFCIFLFYLVVFFLVFLLSAKNASAYEKVIYDGWLYTANSSKTTTGESFSIMLDDSKMLVSVRFGNGLSFLVRQNESEKKGNMTVSFKGVRLGYYDPHKPSSYGTYTEYDEAHIVISADAANVDFKVELDKNEIEIGEKTSVNATFMNNDTRTAENAAFIVSFPSSVKITEIQSCDFGGDYMKWSGSLLSYKRINCVFSLLALEPGTLSAVAVLNYSDGVSNASLKQNIKLKIKEYMLEIKNYLKNHTADVGDIVNLSINLTNTDPEKDIDVDFTLSMDEGIEIVNKSLNLGGNGWKGTLAAGSSPVQLYAMIRAAKSGVNIIKEKGIFKFGFTQTVNEKTLNLTVSSKKLKASYKIKNTSNGKYVDVSVMNNESKLLFKNVNASVVFNNDSYNFSIDAIEPGYYFSIFKKNFSFEELNKSNYITVRLAYSGFYGESFRLFERKNMTEAAAEVKTSAVNVTAANATQNATTINASNITNTLNINAAEMNNAELNNAELNNTELNKTINITSNETKSVVSFAATKDDIKKLVGWFFIFFFVLFFIFLIMSFFKRKNINT